VVLWLGFRIFAPVVESIVKSGRMMDMMRPVMLTIWDMVSQSRGVSEKKKKCSARKIVGIGGSPLVVGVDL